MIRIETFWNDIWLFIRGDLSAKDFESWVYQEEKLEEILGEEFYFELISMDFSSAAEIYTLRKKFALLASENWNKDCYCITLPNLAGVGMGKHE